MNNAIYDLKIFADLEKEVIDDIIKHAKVEYYQAGEIIILQNDESNGKWYIIKSWEVKVEINSMQVALLWIWDIFWEIALLNDEARTATVTAITDVETIIISIDDIMELISNWNSSINNDIMARIEANLINN